ncbi:hypothetical protein [Kordia sp.]|uniref:hypothetical protein n=1 Tax=Kordia sp. TaxID=1965332 RepID=UPI003D6B3D75
MSKQLDQLAFSFFKLFAQYESSLKEKGFFQARNGKILVDWDRFANEVIGGGFMNDLGEKADYADYIPIIQSAILLYLSIFSKEISTVLITLIILFATSLMYLNYKKYSVI